MEQGPPTPWKPVQLLIIPCLLAGIQNMVHTRSARDSMATWLRRDPDEQFSLSSGSVEDPCQVQTLRKWRSKPRVEEAAWCPHPFGLMPWNLHPVLQVSKYRCQFRMCRHGHNL